MAGSGRSWRPTRPRPEMVAAVAVVGIILIVVGLAGPLLRPGPTASPSPGPSAAASPAASPSASPGEAWQAVELPPFEEVAQLVPSAADAAGVAPDATFALTSLTDESASEMAARVTADPPIELAVAPGSDPRTATITPRGGLKPGSQYHVTLQAPDGSLASSWAFRVRSPIHVLSTIPGDRTTQVPARTGIEVTFDQDGVADMADHFTIEPAVTGRFERRGRTQVFVPDQLAVKTLYTVTISAGLARTGTDLVLEQDEVFRFETEGDEARTAWLKFARDTVESSPTEAPVIAVEQLFPYVDDAESQEPPEELTRASVRVYRIPSLAAAISMLEDFLAAPRWTQHTTPSMPTTGLSAVATFTAPVEKLPQESAGVIRFPEPLPKGWYVVEIQGARPSQAYLQVTPISAWVSVLSDKTVVWVNDVRTGKPVAGATAEVVAGAAIGRSDADGLVVGPTPTALIPPAEARDEEVPEMAPPVAVTSPSGDRVLVPFEVGWNGGIYRGEWWEKTESADPTYWSLLNTERGLYRQTDTIHVWGYLRGRDDGSVPPAVTLRLVRSEHARDDDPPAVVRVTATPDPVGVFAASIKLDRVPIGGYSVQAVIEDRVVTSAWAEVGVIRKPAYRLELVPDQLAVITGTDVRWTATATFFDGTRVPDLPLMHSFHAGSDVRVTTDAAGRTVQTTTVAVEARSPDDWDYWDTEPYGWSASVRPATQEEGETWADASVRVFYSSYHLDLDGVVDDRTLRVTGAVDEVDLAKVRAALAADQDWDGDPDGDPVRGATVKMTVTELIPVRRQVGTEYDFIEKVVRPIYEYDTQRKVVRTLSVKTGGDGQLAASVTIPNGDHQYEITAATADPEGRAARKRTYAGQEFDLWWAESGIQFRSPGSTEIGGGPYAIGETITWQMTDDGTPVEASAADRFLYIVAQRGLRSATVTSSPTFERDFEPADAPRIFVMGVRFTGTTYAPKAAAWAEYDIEERELVVEVSADRERYRPGDNATLTVTVRDADGQPAAATVALQGVDEKLFSMGAAARPDPLRALYAAVDSGIVRLTSTHQLPTTAGPEGEGGDTTGGGPREDFRDTVTFGLVATDATGRATTTFELSDDLTSWHISASAMTAGLEAGVDDVLVPVGLPLFIDATIADEYLASDKPIIRLRAYGDGLRSGDPVVFIVASTSLGLPETRLSGTAFQELDVPLPALSVGTHRVTVSVTAPTRLDTAGRPLTDTLIRPVTVVRSRLTAAHTEYVDVGDPLPTTAGDELATFTFSDAGRGRYLPVLEALVDTSSLRVDSRAAGAIARALLIDAFGRDPATLPPDAWDPGRYELGGWEDENGRVHAGLALLPYSSVDPWVAARMGMLAPDSVDVGGLRDALLAVRDGDTSQRDLWIASVAGLAVMGEPVGEDLDLARTASGLSVPELIDLAIGYAGLGDDATARTIERDILQRYGQQLGPWVRIVVGVSDDATAMMTVLAARVGDPLTPAMLEYVRSHRSTETSEALELVAASAAAIERTPTTATAFAYTIDGKRTVVRLEPGESTMLALTAPQRAGLRIEPITGKVGVAIAWRAPTGVASLPRSDDVELTRRLPAGPVPVDRLLTVDITVRFTEEAVTADCYEVIEEVPSGLAPLRDWVGGGQTLIGPSSVSGQRVSFCIPDPVFGGGRVGTLRYMARVVNEGEFTWEPAVLQLEGAAEVGAHTQAGRVTIGTE